MEGKIVHEILWHKVICCNNWDMNFFCYLYHHSAYAEMSLDVNNIWLEIIDNPLYIFIFKKQKAESEFWVKKHRKRMNTKNSHRVHGGARVFECLRWGNYANFVATGLEVIGQPLSKIGSPVYLRIICVCGNNNPHIFYMGVKSDPNWYCNRL